MSIKDTMRKVRAQAKREGTELKKETLAIAATIFGMLDDASFNSANRAQGNGIVNTVITVVVVAVVGLVGILIFSEVDGAITIPDGHALETTADDLGEGFGSAMELLPIVLIVMVAALVIAVISRFR